MFCPMANLTQRNDIKTAICAIAKMVMVMLRHFAAMGAKLRGYRRQDAILYRVVDSHVRCGCAWIALKPCSHSAVNRGLVSHAVVMARILLSVCLHSLANPFGDFRLFSMLANVLVFTIFAIRLMTFGPVFVFVELVKRLRFTALGTLFGWGIIEGHQNLQFWCQARGAREASPGILFVSTRLIIPCLSYIC